MRQIQTNVTPEEYWERAGVVSYAKAMFASAEVEEHVNRRMWAIAVEIGKSLGLTEDAHVLDLGCGDGAFANTVLAKNFRSVDGFDISEAAIRRAQSNAPKPTVRFNACDITRMDWEKLPRYDGVFLIGILHHVTEAAPVILRTLRTVTDKLVVLEPNGNHLIRKVLERTARYKAAGEDSFRTRQMERIIEEAGFRKVDWRRLNLFPNFTPKSLFRLLRPCEPVVENTPLLRALCTVNMWGCVGDIPPAKP